MSIKKNRLLMEQQIQKLKGELNENSTKDHLNENQGTDLLKRIFAKQFPPDMSLLKIVELYDDAIIQHYKSKSKY